MIRLVRRTKARKFLRTGCPVKIARIHNTSSHCHSMAIHVLGCGMDYNIGSPLERIAVDRRRKGIVHDQRHLMRMGKHCKFLNIQNYQRRIGDGLRKDTFRIRSKSFCNLFRRCIRVYYRAVDAHFLHRTSDQIECPSVNSGRQYHMIPRLTDIKHCIMAGGLT